MSLAWTAPTSGNMFQFISERVWYEFSDQTSTWDAWAAANSADANAAKYDGRALTLMFNTGFLSVWPADPAFVKKWTGACLKDYSSGKGGICLLETNDTDTETTTNSPVNIYGMSGNTDVVQGDTTNRGVLTFRISATQFDAFETAWTDMAEWETSIGGHGQDGRCYYNYLKNTANAEIDTTDAAMIEYLDYPSCALGTASDETDYWFCQMYLRKRDQQVDGYPRFDYPGVISGYYVASYIPTVQEISYIKVTHTIAASAGAGATSGVTVFASLLVAGIVSLAF